MAKKGLLIVGAGGHSKVVSEIADLSGDWEIVAYIDENSQIDSFLGKPVFRSISELKAKRIDSTCAFVAVGNNQSRRKWHQSLEASGFSVPILIHPTAVISHSTTIGSGALIAAKSVIGPASTIGKGALINTSSIVDHDSNIGEFAHISQACVLCGGVQIMENALLGPGVVVEKMGLVNANAVITANSVISTK